MGPVGPVAPVGPVGPTTDERSMAAWHAGAREEGRVAALRLVAEGRFPASERERIEKNLAWYA